MDEGFVHINICILTHCMIHSPVAWNFAVCEWSIPTAV